MKTQVTFSAVRALVLEINAMQCKHRIEMTTVKSETYNNYLINIRGENRKYYNSITALEAFDVLTAFKNKMLVTFSK